MQQIFIDSNTTYQWKNGEIINKKFNITNLAIQSHNDKLYLYKIINETLLLNNLFYLKEMYEYLISRTLLYDSNNVIFITNDSNIYNIPNYIM